MTALKPPFTYFGGETAIAERIAALLPPHEHYVEPFAGSLSVLLAKPPAPMETVNDLSHDLMTFWKVLRERPAELERACTLTPHSRIEHQVAREPATDELEQARRIWIRLTQGRAVCSTGWRNHHQLLRGNTVPDDLRTYTERMKSIADRLHSVTLECRPAFEVIEAYGRYGSNLIYADPPYLGSVRSSGNAYAVEMRSDEERRELLEALLSCRAAVVLSGYASELYDGLLTTWFRREIATQTGNGGDDRARVEVLWSNHSVPAWSNLGYD